MAEAEDFEEDYEKDLIDSGLVGILDMLNFKIVSKEPGDPNYSQFNEVIPPESRLYAAEFVRLKDENDKLKKEMTDMASSSELQVREELTETKEALERERKAGEEVKEAMVEAQREVEESKEALVEKQREAEEAKKALVMEQKKVEESKEAVENAQKEVEEANKAFSEEQGKVENLREVVTKMQEQLNEEEKKNQKQKEEQEKLKQLISSTNKTLEEMQLKLTEKEKEIEASKLVNEKLRQENEEMGKVNRVEKDNLDTAQREKEKLEGDLRKSTSTNSQLQENLSKADTANFELQAKLDALQEKFTEVEDKLKEANAKCNELKTGLEETTTQLNKQEYQLIEAGDIIKELKKAGDKFDVLNTQFERVVQLNLGLDEQVSDLQRKLREKTIEVENVQRDLNTEREEKSKMQAKLTRYRESLQSCNLELTQFIEELKNTIGVADEGVDTGSNTLQSRLESLSARVQSKLKSREDNLKELQAELAKTKQTIMAIHEHLRRQSVERIAMPPPPPPHITRRAIMPPPPASNSVSLLPTLSYRDISRPQGLEAPTETTSANLFSDFDFPSLRVSHGIIATSFGDSDFGGTMDIGSDSENDVEEITLIECRKCVRTFQKWAELYQHQKTVHTVQMSKKVIQQRATTTSVKTIFGTYSTKQKKKKDNPAIKIKQRKKGGISIPKIKIKQRKTRSGAYWNIVPPSTILKDNEDDENQNENTSMEAIIQSPSPEPLDPNSQNDNQNPSSSNQNVETESPQHRPPLSEVGNSTTVGATAVVQTQQHGIDKTKSRNGSFCLCGRKCKDKYQLMSHIKYYTTAPKFSCTTCGLRFKKTSHFKSHLKTRTHKLIAKKSTMETCRLCRQNFYTKEQLTRHQAAVHPPIPQRPHASVKRSQPDRKQNVEGSQSQDLINESSDNINSSAAPAQTTPTSKNHPNSAAELHGVDTTRQDQGAFCICGGKYSSKQNLDVHIGYFTLDWKFECGICSQRFYYLTYLRRHYADSHQEPNILDEYVVGCRKCGDMFRSWDEYHIHSREHLKSKTNRKLLKTKPGNHLERRQPSSSQVTSKSKGTTSSKMTHCQDISKEHLGLFCVCGFQSVDQNTLTKHIAQYSGDKKFDCNICHQKFKLLSNLQSHLKVAHNAKSVRPLFGCQHCGKIFLAQAELLNHAVRDHPSAKRKRKKEGNSTPISKPTSEPPVPPPPPSSSQQHIMDVDISRIKIEQTDPELGAITDHNTSKVKHGIDYSKVRLGFYCKCGFKSPGRFAKHNLRRHIKYFNAETHFECPECQLSFKSTSRLRLHMRTAHNKEYPFIGCATCGNLFDNFEALREHKKLQHSRKRKIEEIDLTNVPTPASQRVEEDLEELQQDGEFTTTAAPTKKVPLSLSSQKALSLPTLPKKKHEKDMAKRHLGYFCVCGTKTRTATALHSHITYFTSDKKFECELCGHRSLYLAGLKRHLKSTHKLTNLCQLDQMGMGCSLCGKRGFTNVKELTIHKSTAHSTLDTSNTKVQTDCMEPQPSTSKGLPVTTNARKSVNSGHAKQPSIIISTRSPSIKSVVPSSASIFREASLTPVSPLNRNRAHAIDQAKLKAGLFFCICGYSTERRPNLWNHISYMSAVKKYACPFCKKKFRFMAYLRRHAKVTHKHHNPDLSGCTTCSKVFSSRGELLKHSLSMHSQSNNQGLQVPDQPMLPSSPAAISSTAIIEKAASVSSSTVWIPVTPSISVSLRTRTNEPGAITLPSQPSSSHVESSYLSAAGGKSDEDMIIDAHLTYEPCIPQVQHAINHEMLLNGFYYCLCGQDFDNANALDKHVKYYSSEGKFICKTCGHAFLLATYLRNHMLRVHKIVYNISNGCKHCGKTFPTNMQLYEHFRMEHNNGHMWEPREQKYTPPTTSQSQPLSQELPYSQEQIIEIQDQNAQQKSQEEKHAMEERDPLCENSYFSCKCGTRFKSLLRLNRHIRNTKKEYIFKCYRCTSKFNSHCNLKAHVVRVHKVPYEKGKYSCGVCAETFETCERMKTHKKDVHGIS